MKLKDSRVFKRLTVFIPIATFIVTYIIILVAGINRGIQVEDAFLLVPVICFLVAAGTFLLIQIVSQVSG